MKILRRAGYQRMAWKNGGGLTEEILREPAAGAAFDWRLSMAQVDVSGPFSDFSGHTRLMLLLAGAGMTLRCQGEPDRVLRKPGDLLRFDGGLRIDCSLHGGACTDLNLMVAHRLPFEARVEALPAPLLLRAAPHQTRIVVALQALRMVTGAQRETLGPLDTAVVDVGESLVVQPDGEGLAQAFIASIGAG